MLLVLGGVAGDGLVAELGELDPELLGGDAVGAGADDRPVPLGRRQLLGGGGDRGAAGDRLLHGVGQFAQAGEHVAALGPAGLAGRLEPGRVRTVSSSSAMA